MTHVNIVNVLSTLQISLGDEATDLVAACTVVVLRSMLPAAITPAHIRIYAGDTKAIGIIIINETDQAATKVAADLRVVRMRRNDNDVARVVGDVA